MPFVPVPHAVQTRVKFALGGAEQAVNVLHFDNLGDVEINAVTSFNLATLIEGSWDANLKSQQSNNVVLAAVEVKDISAPDLPTFRWDFNESATNAAKALPYQCSACVTLRTAVGTRGGRGRVYLAGFASTTNSTGDDSIDDDTRGFCEAFLQDLQNITNLGGDAAADFNLGVVSRFAHVGADPLGAPIAPVIRDVTQISCNKRWDTQRRRSNALRF